MAIAFGPYPWAYFEWQLMSLEEKERAAENIKPRGTLTAGKTKNTCKAGPDLS